MLPTQNALVVAQVEGDVFNRPAAAAGLQVARLQSERLRPGSLGPGCRLEVAVCEAATRIPRARLQVGGCRVLALQSGVNTSSKIRDLTRWGQTPPHVSASGIGICVRKTHLLCFLDKFQADFGNQRR